MHEDLKLKISEVHDIHQKQKDNRTVIKPLQANVTEDKLSKLMYDWEHYFDKGYFVDMSPEKLKQAIMDEIDLINKPPDPKELEK